MSAFSSGPNKSEPWTLAATGWKLGADKSEGEDVLQGVGCIRIEIVLDTHEKNDWNIVVVVQPGLASHFGMLIMSLTAEEASIDNAWLLPNLALVAFSSSVAVHVVS
jgi:hypothetical protein